MPVSQRFLTEARKRLARMKKTGLGVPAEEVFAYLEQRARGLEPARPKPRRLGLLDGKFSVPDELDAPLSARVTASFKRRKC
jgi:hypothetical protein